MNATIRCLKGLLVLAVVGLLLRWLTTGSIDAAAAQDLTSMASLAIGAVAWFAYCWLAFAVLATVLEQAPGAIGRSASAVAARITSHGSRALLRSALGVAAVTPLTIGVANAAPGDSSYAATDSRSAATIAGDSTTGTRPWNSVEPRSTINIGGESPADWRAVEKPSSIQVTGEGAGKLPEGAAPGKPTPTGRTAVPTKPPAGQVPVPDRPTTGAPTRYTHLQSGQLARAAPHRVKPGDSLWSIAAAELGPNAPSEAIAARWPQWYAANRQLIGPNPNLIHPGQVLTAPAPAHPAPPTHQEK